MPSSKGRALSKLAGMSGRPSVRSYGRQMRDTRVAEMVTRNKGKIALGMGAVGLMRAGMSRSGSAADKPRGRPTGPYMF